MSPLPESALPASTSLPEHPLPSVPLPPSATHVASRPRGYSEEFRDVRESWGFSSQSSEDEEEEEDEDADKDKSTALEEAGADLPADVMPPPSTPPPPPPTREDLVRECKALRDSAAKGEDEGRALQAARAARVRQEVLEQRDAGCALQAQLQAAQSAASSEERERELRYTVAARRREVQHMWQQVLALRACAAAAVAGKEEEGGKAHSSTELQDARHRLGPMRQACESRVALLRRAVDGTLSASRRGSTSLDRDWSTVDSVELRKRLKVARHQRDRAKQSLGDRQNEATAPPPELLHTGTFGAVVCALRRRRGAAGGEEVTGTGRDRISALQDSVRALQSRAEALRSRVATDETQAQGMEQTRQALADQFGELRASLGGTTEGYEAERTRLCSEVEALEASAREFEGLDARGAARCVAQRVKGVRKAAEARSQARLAEARQVLQRKVEEREEELHSAFRREQESLVAQLEARWRGRVAQAQAEVAAVVRGRAAPRVPLLPVLPDPSLTLPFPSGQREQVDELEGQRRKLQERGREVTEKWGAAEPQLMKFRCRMRKMWAVLDRTTGGAQGSGPGAGSPPKRGVPRSVEEREAFLRGVVQTLPLTRALQRHFGREFKRLAEASRELDETF